MDLTHRFSVPSTLDEVWRAFNDLEHLAPCFPGATITAVDGDDFTGAMKIKLGPIALLYTGSGRYVERDQESHRVLIEASGQDRRGNGTGTATVRASFVANGDNTDVEVVTDLTLTGKPAQFGASVIADVSDKLLEQFATCVALQFLAGSPSSEPPPETAEEPASEAALTVELGAIPEELDSALPTSPDGSAIPTAAPQAAPAAPLLGPGSTAVGSASLGAAHTAHAARRRLGTCPRATPPRPT